MFGFLLIVTKKALLLTKVALFLSGLLGWNRLFSGTPVPSYPANAFNDFHAYEHGIPADVYSHYEYHYPQRPYKKTLQDYAPFDQHVIREVVNVYEGNNDSRNRQNAKNFVWTQN